MSSSRKKGSNTSKIQDSIKASKLSKPEIAKMVSEMNSLLVSSQKMFTAFGPGKSGNKLPKSLKAICKGDCNLNQAGVKDDLALAGMGGIMTGVLGLSGKQIEAVGAALKNDGSVTPAQKRTLNTVFDTMGNAYEARMRSGVQSGGAPPRRSARGAAAAPLPPDAGAQWSVTGQPLPPHLETDARPASAPPGASQGDAGYAQAPSAPPPPPSAAGYGAPGEPVSAGLTTAQVQQMIDAGVTARLNAAQRQQPALRSSNVGRTAPTLATVAETAAAADVGQVRRFWWQGPAAGEECSAFQIAMATTGLMMLAGGAAYGAYVVAPEEAEMVWESVPP